MRWADQPGHQIARGSDCVTASAVQYYIQNHSELMSKSCRDSLARQPTSKIACVLEHCDVCGNDAGRMSEVHGSFDICGSIIGWTWISGRARLARRISGGRGSSGVRRGDCDYLRSHCAGGSRLSLHDRRCESLLSKQKNGSEACVDHGVL